jgi:hypothetical protein
LPQLRIHTPPERRVAHPDQCDTDRDRTYWKGAPDRLELTMAKDDTIAYDLIA